MAMHLHSRYYVVYWYGHACTSFTKQYAYAAAVQLDCCNQYISYMSTRPCKFLADAINNTAGDVEQ